MIVVFAGPTIGREAVLDHLGADVAARCTVLGPARQGDVMRACRLGARVIAVIDGYFQAVPAIWHKEILWAMSEGVHVVGAASMGALRAAELHTFGMVGVGTVFEWFRDGVLVRDDEVAVAHADAEHEYRVVSEALVNIRSTLRTATAAGVLDAEQASDVLRDAAARFYPERHWPSLVDELALAHGAAVGEGLTRFLREGGRVDQKRLDALALLTMVRDDDRRWTEPTTVSYTLSHTIWFDDLHRSSGEFAGNTGNGSVGTVVGVTREDIDDELRLRRHYRPALRASMLRHLTGSEARRRRIAVDPVRLGIYANAVCRDLGLTDQASFDTWLHANGLTVEEFNDLMARELQRSIVLNGISVPAGEELVDVLRLAGLWPQVSARAARKVRLLDEAGLADPALEHSGFASQAELVEWWLSRIGQDGPAISRDIDTLSQLADFPDTTTFVQSLLRERCAELLGLEPLDDAGRWW